MQKNSESYFTWIVPADLAGSLSPLFQYGVMVKVQIGSGIMSLLCDQLKLSPEFIERWVQTVFLNGKPVDDLHGATVKDGDTLALSGAMPGLVGATMRRGGYYAPFRSSISHHEENPSTPQKEGTITVKLFNFVASEMGPDLLKNGAFVKGKVLQDLVKSMTVDFRKQCKAIDSDGKVLNEEDWIGADLGDGSVFLSVE